MDTGCRKRVIGTELLAKSFTCPTQCRHFYAVLPEMFNEPYFNQVNETEFLPCTDGVVVPMQ